MTADGKELALGTNQPVQENFFVIEKEKLYYSNSNAY